MDPNKVRILLAVLGGLLFFWATVNASHAADIYLRSKSPTYPSQALRNDLRGLQAGLNSVHRWWGGESATLRIGVPSPGAQRLTVIPAVDPFGPLGYHFIGPNQTPYAIVYDTPGWSTSTTISHELEEMYVDPQINRTAMGTRLWSVEVCDPVEDESYWSHGTLLSDFIGPSWYAGGPKKTFDYKHRLKHKEQLLPGGYASYWNGIDWITVDG